MVGEALEPGVEQIQEVPIVNRERRAPASLGSCKDGAEVVFCTIDDGGHTWPGGMDMSALGFGKTTQDLIANDAMWDLFQKHPLP